MKLALITALSLSATACAVARPTSPATSQTLTASSTDLSCSVALGGADRVEIAPTIIGGEIEPDAQTTFYKGHSVSVVFQAGDQFDGQQMLTINLDGQTREVYDPTRSLYNMSAADGVEVQCYLASGESAPTMDAQRLSCSADSQGHDKVALGIMFGFGAEDFAPIVNNYKGHQIEVVFVAGDASENQQMLQTKVDGVYSQTYDPGRSLHKHITSDGTQVQCYFE